MVEGMLRVMKGEDVDVDVKVNGVKECSIRLR